MTLLSDAFSQDLVLAIHPSSYPPSSLPSQFVSTLTLRDGGTGQGIPAAMESVDKMSLSLKNMSDFLN